MRSRFICADCGVEDIRNGKRCFPCLARIALDDLQKLTCRIVGLRGAALLNLASTMPLAPLCGLTGMSSNVAARRQIVAASPYAQYPAIRL